MADIRYEVKLWQSDGTVFSSALETGGAVRLRSSTVAGADSGEYTGNDATSGVFTEVGQGLWYIMIDSADSGYFRIESYTTAAGAYSAVDGFNPKYISLAPFLPTAGGTMSGNIVMADNSVTGLDTLTFTDTDGTVAGIANKNLVDKATTETVTGAWAHTGFIDITASKLKIGGTVVSSTAADLNLVSGKGTAGELLSLQNQLALITPESAYAAAHTITLAQVGHVTTDSSGGTFQMILPLVNESSSGIECTIIETVGGNDITVIDNAANGGFVLTLTATTEATGTTCTFGATQGEYITVKSSGGTGGWGYWSIIVSKGIALT